MFEFSIIKWHFQSRGYHILEELKPGDFERECIEEDCGKHVDFSLNSCVVFQDFAQTYNQARSHNSHKV